jgi:site-specific DNA recombinase
MSVPWSPASSTRRREVIGAAEDVTLRPIRAETRARLIEGIARARAWLDDLTSGRVRDTREIAIVEGCSERSVRMTLNLAFLAPEIVSAAVQGTLPDRLGSSRLVEAPIAWRDQRRIVNPAASWA